MAQPDYFDKRSEFWKRHWEIAQNYEDYLSSSNAPDVSRWIESENRTPVLTEDQRRRLQGYNRTLNVLFYCGIWCGDCQRQGPMLREIAQALEKSS